MQITLDSSIYQLVFKHSPVGEYLLAPTPEATILAVNDTFLRLVCRSREELVGKGLFEAFPASPDELDPSGVAVVHQALERVIATGQPATLPLQRYPIAVQLPDGSQRFEERFWSASNTPVFNREGKLICILHHTVDVTERKLADDAARNHVARQAFQLALADRIRPMTDAGEVIAAGCELLGKKLGAQRVVFGEIDESGEHLTINRDWTDGSLASLAGAHLNLKDFGPRIVDVVRSGHLVAVDDVISDSLSAPYAQAYLANGVRAFLSIPLLKNRHLLAVLKIHDSQIHHWSSDDIDLANDMVDRIWSAIENARTQARLKEADKRKDEFLAMLAHELRNPLAPIGTAAELLQLGKLDRDGVLQASRIIGRQVAHMTHLVNDLLDVSRVTRGLVNLERSPLDLRQLVADAVEQVMPMIRLKHQHLALHLPPAPAMVLGDEKRLVQVVANLLNNASKYTAEDGHLQLRIEARNGRVVVMLSDDGIGMAPDLVKRAFELFTQAERSSDRSAGGLGLGLALVKSLVELHGGKVRCRSPGPGQGSTFTVCLPRWKAGTSDCAVA